MTKLPAELTALVVDDEVPLRGILTRMLNRNGILNVDSVATTKEGIELLERKPYNLVFTDLNQQPSGIEVYRNATSKGAQAYIMTGYSPDMSIAQDVAKGHFLMKPSSLQEIDIIIKENIMSQNPQS